ncbi:MAG: VOC family protein [Saprospiraceae bacterium]
MAKVTGVGGVFIVSKDPAAMRTWYAEKLGIPMEQWGAQFSQAEESHASPYTVLSFFEQGSKYMNPSSSGFMLNLRVENLPAFLEKIKKKGVQQIDELVDEDYGKFAWILDPEGNKIELWEQGA